MLFFREQFESKIFRARTASERDRTSYEKDRRFPLNDEHDYDMKSRSSSLKLNESRDVEKKTDKLFSNLNDDQQLRKDIENDEEFHVEIRKNFRRNDRSKEYPLRSVMEGNKTMHSDKSHSPQFQWVCEIGTNSVHYSIIILNILFWDCGLEI